MTLSQIFVHLLYTASDALSTALRRPYSSSAATPSMVVPAGDHTWSFKTAGCSPVSNTMAAAPFTACAANT